MSVDMEGFEQEMEAQRERARAAHAFTGAMEMLPVYENLGVGVVEFVGYRHLAQESVVTALLVEDTPIGNATQGQRVEVVLMGDVVLSRRWRPGGGRRGDYRPQR